jgi:glycosyltransferase involved in cell wall biosynthesis
MKHHIVLLTSHPMSVASFMRPHIKALKVLYDVHVLANTSETNLIQQLRLDFDIETVPIVRHISLLADIKAFWHLYRRFSRTSVSAVHTITPKAGLLGMSAAWLAGVPVRVHSFTGQVWATRTGPMRWLLKLADKCTAFFATDVLVDSQSQRNFLITEGVVRPKFSAVLGSGSICGVDTKRFYPNPANRQKVRESLGTPSDTLVCLYLGRLNHDKGVLDLAAAFSLVAENYPLAELWVVGPDEANWFELMQAKLGHVLNRVKRIGFTTDPAIYMQAADIFCLPSYREGFGSSVIEAAACGVPTLASRIYGLTDAVVEGKTGWMHEAGNIQDISKQLMSILGKPEDLSAKGLAAKQYAVDVFSEEKITEAMVSFYKTKLN